MPPTRSGAPASSVWMCAVVVHTTAPIAEHRLQPDDVRAGAVEHREHLGLGAEVCAEDLLQRAV